MQSPNLKSILNCSIHERSPSLQVLWQHYQSEVNPEGAYSNDPYRREAIVLHALWQLGQFEINPEGASFTEPFRRNAFSCMFCGNMISTKSKFKEHTQMLHTGENTFSARVVATSTPHKGGNTIELPPWKKGWHRPVAPQYARPHFMRCRSPPYIVSTEWEDKRSGTA